MSSRRDRVLAPLLVAAALILSVSACQRMSVDEVESVYALPADWYAEPGESARFDEGWCADYGDPVLALLIEQVLSSNLDLQIAAARLDEARAVLRQSRSQRLPRVGLEAGVEREWTTSGHSSDFEISAPVSYEVDLWGRIGAEIFARETDYEAMQLDLQTLRVAISAETAELYFELLRVRAERALLDGQFENASTLLELTRLRHAQGMANAIDVVQQQQQLEALRESVLRSELDEVFVLSGLATLLGRPRAEVVIESTSGLPEAAPMSSGFLPADLLVRRPDVAAARLRVVAADARVDAALAERLPRLTLSASVGTQAMNAADLFQFLFVSVAGLVSQPVFEGGRLRARADEERAVREQQLLDFSRVLLAAISEVEDSMAQGEALRRIRETQQRQLEAAREALELAEAQYRSGIFDYLRVLVALQSVQSLELAELESQRGLLSQRIQLCRAAGGVWPAEEQAASEGADSADVSTEVTDSSPDDDGPQNDEANE